jgi:hypothetical protein
MFAASCSVPRLPIGETNPFVTIPLMMRRELARLFPEARLVPQGIGSLVKSWHVAFAGGAA